MDWERQFLKNIKDRDAFRLERDKAQSELAALREELADCKRSNEIIRNQKPSEIFEQRLTAVEQRNTELIELLRMAWGVEHVSAEDCRRIDATLATESSASE